MDNNAKTYLKNNKRLYIALTVVIFIILCGGIGFRLGYRFESNFMIGKIGVVSMEIPFSQTNIFIDQSQKITTSKENENVKFSLSPGNHSVISSHNGYFPWKKDFSMPSGGNLTLSPIFISQNASGLIITKSDSEYWKIKNLIIKDSLPTKDLPRFSTDSFATTWMEDNAIFAKINGKIYKVIQPDTVIKNLYFYKDRSDSVIFSTNNAIYMIEIDKTGTQNFIPIYKGQNPYFIKGDSNYIYVLDGDTLMQVLI